MLEFQTKKLTVDNYFAWSEDLKTIFGDKGLWKHVMSSNLSTLITHTLRSERDTENGIENTAIETAVLIVTNARTKNIELTYMLTSIYEACKYMVRGKGCLKMV